MSKQIINTNAPLIAAIKSLGLDISNVTRIVIDLQSGHYPIVHVEMIGDSEGVIEVVRTLSGVEINRKETSDG